MLISFGIGDGVTVFSIMRLSTIRKWGCMIGYGNGKLISPAIEMVFSLMFEQSENGLPEGIKFDACIFRRPPMNHMNEVKKCVGALQLTVAITDGCDDNVEQDGITKVEIVDESSKTGCLKRTIEFPNLK